MKPTVLPDYRFQGNQTTISLARNKKVDEAEIKSVIIKGLIKLREKNLTQIVQIL